MRDDQDLSGQVQEPCQGLPMIAQNYSDEDSEDEILRRDVQAEQEMEEDIQEFNQTLKERRRGTLFKNPSIMPDESLREVQEPPEDDSNVEPPEDDGDDNGDDNLVPEPVPDLETTQVVQDSTIATSVANVRATSEAPMRLSDMLKRKRASSFDMPGSGSSETPTRRSKFADRTTSLLSQLHPGAPPEEQFRTQLETLVSMGFVDTQANIQGTEFSRFPSVKLYNFDF